MHRCFHREFVLEASKLIEEGFNGMQWCGTYGTRNKEAKRHIKKTQSRHEGTAELFSVGLLSTLQSLLIIMQLQRLKSNSLRNHKTWSGMIWLIVNYGNTSTSTCFRTWLNKICSMKLFSHQEATWMQHMIKIFRISLSVFNWFCCDLCIRNNT